MSVRWHILTPELPPECGGVGDYSAQVASALAASGDDVTVYCPPAESAWNAPSGVEVVMLGDRFGMRSVNDLTRRLDRDRAARMLVQYVPSVYGRRGNNLAFCRWLQSRSRIGTDVRIMFHEPYLYLRWRPDHVVTAFTQRAMAATLVDAATHLYLSTDTWRRYLARFGAAGVEDAITLPIPSAIPCVDANHAVRAMRATSAGHATHLIGHFGSYGNHVATPLRRALKDLLTADSAVAALCVGRGSDRFVAQFIADNLPLRGRVTATGRASAHDVSVQLQACDVLIQPFPDGVTTRRTSVMAGLANGRAVVTINGKLTEEVWRSTGSVALVAPADPFALSHAVRELLADVDARHALEARASATYNAAFALHHTIEGLQADSLALSAS